MSQPTIIKYIPEEYTQYLIQYHNEHNHEYDIFDWEEDELYLRMWGLTEKSKISGRAHAANSQAGSGLYRKGDEGGIDPRWGGELNNEDEFNSLVRNVLDLFNVTDYTQFEAYIKTSYLPISLHVDANRYKGPVSSHQAHEGEDIDRLVNGTDARLGISIIIPLTFNKNIHTVIFKNIAEDNEHLREFLEDIAGVYEVANYTREHKARHPTYEHNLDYRDYVPNLWNYQMMAFHFDPQNNRYARGDKILDYLEVDEIIVWEENVAFLLDKQKMHTSNNFRKLGIESKNFVLIHTH